MKLWKCDNCAREKESEDIVQLLICIVCQIEMELIKKEVTGDAINSR